MTTSRVFNHGRIFWQSSDMDNELPNEAIAIHVDNGDSLCIDQGGRSIVLNLESIKEFCDTVKGVVADHSKAQKRS